MKTFPASPAYGWPQLDVAPGAVATLPEIHDAVARLGCRYRLGAKVVPLGARAGAFRFVDCSGYVRWLLNRIGVPMPDGSAAQHGAARAAGLKQSDVAALSAQDGALRIVFLPPLGNESGHVALWLDGLSIESHGPTIGPSRRPSGACAWLSRAVVYVLTPPRPL